MLARILIKNITSTQLKEVVDNCGRATLVISPSYGGLWTVSVCLKQAELDNMRKKGYELEKVPG